MARKRVIDTGLYFDTEICKLLGPRGLHLYIRLWGIAEDWGGYEANYEDIALQMGALKFTQREVKKFIESLITAGKIIPYSTGNGRIYHWLKNFSKHQPLNNPGPPRLPLPEWIRCELKNYNSGKSYAKYEVIQEKIPVGYQYTTSNVETETETETETKQKRNETLIPKGVEGFETFWEEYPKKRKIGDAEKAWNKIKPNIELREIISKKIVLLKKAEDWVKENGKYIPYPATWLNARGWKDEVKEESWRDKVESML